MAFSSPTPTVAHLLTIFRQISNGELRIPAFQREFVWQQSQILDLLESVRQGYPIGSILVWYVDRAILKVTTNRHAFPNLPERYPTNYILDGMQRLSSLYGVFHYGEHNSESRFNVSFDLIKEEFFVPDEPFSEDRKIALPLSALFSPRKLLEFQSTIAYLPETDELLDKVVSLQSSFQDYMIPIVSIRGDDVRPIVNVFERVNSTGTTLGRTDFMRAITWDQNFDLTTELENALGFLSDLAFPLSEETIIKCISIQVGQDASSDALLSLRNQSTSDLHSAFDAFRDIAFRTISFCRTVLSVYSSKLMPYEGQWLVLFKAVGVDRCDNSEELILLKRWFWAVSFNESLRGKPDHYVSRAVTDWRSVVTGRIRGLEPRLKVSKVDFMERRLIKGKALSSAFLGLFIHSGAKEIQFDGGQSSSALYMEAETNIFQNIISKEELGQINNIGSAPGKIFANLLMVDPSTNLSSKNSIKNLIGNMYNSGQYELLNSQFIDQQVFDHLVANEFREFLERRAGLMHDGARVMVES